MNITLFKKDVSGNVRVWSIERSEVDEITISYGLLGGAIQEKIETVEVNQSGRTLDEQVMSRMASRISKQRDAGYVNKYEDAKISRATNVLKLPRPMLAKKLADTDLPTRYYIQFKYDGNRCLITKRNGKVFAYSRNGKIIDSIDHILGAAADLPEGVILDGELYHHGTPLQTIRSWISRKQAESESLVYMCYDCMGTLPFKERLARLEKFNLYYPITLAKTTLINDSSGLEYDIYKALKEAKSNGYEGLIARDPDSPYEDGKRSKGLVKIKSMEDDEFTVIGIKPSVDNWAILICEARNGKLFNVSAPGSIQDKEYILLHKKDYIGRMITVEYANLTKIGKPFHPVALAFRDSSD